MKSRTKIGRTEPAGKLLSTGVGGTVAIERYRLCSSCGNFSTLVENQQYCISCGSKLIETCQHCREPIYYPTAKFCPSCGEKYGKE